MPNILLNLFIVIITAIFMEWVAWATHKYVMHGFLWVLHQDHHRPQHRGLQKNDLFSVFFALISAGLIAPGITLAGWLPAASVGFGMMVYGVGYFLFHEVAFHKRLRSLRIRPRGRYLRHIIHAHSIHHRNIEKSGQEPYSFLYPSPRHAPSE